MKFFITLTLLALVRTALAQSIQFGLLVCEQGPVIYRQTSAKGVSFQVNPPSVSQCRPGKVVCNQDLGFFPAHGGLIMCSVSRDCVGRQQVCLRRFSAGSNAIIGCCKPGFEAWALSGTQKTSGQFPAPQQLVRVANPSLYPDRIAALHHSPIPNRMAMPEPSNVAVHLAAHRSPIPNRMAMPEPSNVAVHLAAHQSPIPNRMAMPEPSNVPVHRAAHLSPVPVRIMAHRSISPNRMVATDGTSHTDFEIEVENQ